MVKSTPTLQRTIGEARTLRLSPLNGGSKSEFVFFVNKTQFLSNTVCYFTMCENF